MRAESPGSDVGKMKPRVRDTAAILYKIYLIISVSEAILLLLGDMPLFDACTGSTGGGMTTISTLTAVFSCVNDIGPGLDMVEPVENFSYFYNFSKIVLLIDMLRGRLELFPFLIAGLPSMWKRRKNPVIG